MLPVLWRTGNSLALALALANMELAVAEAVSGYRYHEWIILANLGFRWTLALALALASKE